jgi:hypothetical protein
MAKPSAKVGKMVFTADDDRELKALVGTAKIIDWFDVAALMSRPFTHRQCRERWNHYLNPTICLDSWTVEEEALLLGEFRRLGNKWMALSRLFKGRSAGSVRNHVLCILRRNGIQLRDPVVPVLDGLGPHLDRDLSDPDFEDPWDPESWDFSSLCLPTS